MALMAFDSKPTKSKKQQREEKAEFPDLGEEEKKDEGGLDSLMDEPPKSKNQGKRKGKGGNKGGAVTLKVGFF